MSINALRMATTVGLFTLLFGCASTNHSDQLLEGRMRSIADDVESGRVQRVTVFSVPSKVRTFVALTPSALEQISKYSVTTNLEGTIKSELVTGLKATTGGNAAVQPDLRWGAYFLDSKNYCVAKIYLDAGGTGAIVDGTPARVSRHLVRWFRKYFSPESVRQ